MATKAEIPRAQIEKQDWQLLKSVTECNRHMLENGIATDVTFLVSDENAASEVKTLHAHKYVLISRSPVFYSMFCGLLAERGEIRVTDVHPEAFRQMLNFIYTDDLELNLDLVVHVINAANKYLLPRLMSKCANFLKNHLDTDNVCTILDQILIFENKYLNKICLNIIMKETNKVLQSKAFLAIRGDTLSKILTMTSCEVKEVEVFKACLKWARQKCEKAEKEASGVNIRRALLNCITQFRFSDIEDFARDVCPTGVFTKEEENDIFRHLAIRQTTHAPDEFHCEPRLRPIYTVHTTEEVQHIECDELYFDIKVLSNNNTDIEVNTLTIGKASSLSRMPISSCSIKYKDVNLKFSVSKTKDNININIKFNGQLIIQPGSATLQVAYQVGDSRRYDTHAANVYGVPRRKITLKDNRINLNLSTDDRFIPFVGLTYKMVP